MTEYTGITISKSDRTVGGMLSAEEGLQKLICVMHGYCNKWRLKANVCM